MKFFNIVVIKIVITALIKSYVIAVVKFNTLKELRKAMAKNLL